MSQQYGSSARTPTSTRARAWGFSGLDDCLSLGFNPTDGRAKLDSYGIVFRGVTPVLTSYYVPWTSTSARHLQNFASGWQARLPPVRGSRDFRNHRGLRG